MAAPWWCSPGDRPHPSDPGPRRGRARHPDLGRPGLRGRQGADAAPRLSLGWTARAQAAGRGDGAAAADLRQRRVWRCRSTLRRRSDAALSSRGGAGDATTFSLAASGPGGQNVNKVATACQLRCDVFRLGLAPDVYQRLKALAGSRMKAAGEIVITARPFRTQEANREDARARLAELIAKAHVRQAKRRRDPAEPGGQGETGRRQEAAGRQAAESEALVAPCEARMHWSRGLRGLPSRSDVRLQDRSGGQGLPLSRADRGGRRADRRRARRDRQHGQCRGPAVGERCPTSTGRASTAISAASWCSARSRAGRPASASRSARASAARPRPPSSRSGRRRPRLSRPYRLRRRQRAPSWSCRSSRRAAGRRARSRQPEPGPLRRRRRSRLCHTDTAPRSGTRRHGKGRPKGKDRFDRTVRMRRCMRAIYLCEAGDPGMRKWPAPPGSELRPASGSARLRPGRLHGPAAARRHGGGMRTGGGIGCTATGRRQSMHRWRPMAATNFRTGCSAASSSRNSGSAPQFSINDWQMYRLRRRGPDGRWIRYYDDAYLIDRDGRVRDSPLRRSTGIAMASDWDYGRRHPRLPRRPRDYDGLATRIMPMGEEPMRGDMRGGDMRVQIAARCGLMAAIMRHSARRARLWPAAGLGMARLRCGAITHVYRLWLWLRRPYCLSDRHRDGRPPAAGGGYSEEVIEEVVAAARRRRAGAPRCGCVRAPARGRPSPPRPPGERG